jgi:hypothetical protein
MTIDGYPILLGLDHLPDDPALLTGPAHVNGLLAPAVSGGTGPLPEQRVYRFSLMSLISFR